MTSTPTPPELTPTQVRRARLIAYLFRRARIRIKDPCLRCARPFLVERPAWDSDHLPFCPDCLSRTGAAPNTALYCDCGLPAVIVAYITIRHPGTPHATSQPIALCELCAVDELLAAVKSSLPD